MQHSLDGTPITAPAATLRELLALARDQLEAGRLVVEVRAGERALSADEIEARLPLPLAGEPLSLVSAEPGSLATAALDAALDQLSEVGNQQIQAADRLQADQPGEAFALLGDALAGWIQVSAAASQACQLTGVDLASLDVGGVSGAEAAVELAERLRGLRSEVEAHDTIALADSLAYVWPEVVERWQRLLEELQSRIESRAANPPAAGA